MIYVAVIWYRDIPAEQKPAGIPDYCPYRTVMLGDFEEPPPAPGEVDLGPWTVLTEGAFSAIINDPDVIAAQVAWEAAQNPPPDYIDMSLHREFRFDTHNFADPADWDGRTTGDPARELALAVDPNAIYDDIRYRWLRPDGSVIYRLDKVIETPLYDGTIKFDVDDRVTPRLWLDEDGNPVVDYNETTRTWHRRDTNADVTSSRWLINPYDGTLMQVNTCLTIGEPEAEIPLGSAMRYRMWSFGAALIEQFVYYTVRKLRNNASGSPEEFTGKFGQKMQTYAYDYTNTEPWMIDSTFAMTLEVSMDGHVPIENSQEAYGAFIGIEYGQRILPPWLTC